jgi:FolB domain-containing protein
MDTIIIQDLEVHYRVGVPEAERAEPQRLLLTLEMTTDFTTAAVKDDLHWSINYDAVCRRLREYGEPRNWHLIETAAVELADYVMREFGPTSLLLEVKKLSLPQTRYVSVRVTRPQ